MINENLNSPEGKLLGKTVAFPQSYDPSILVAVPRILNRRQYGLENEALPFVGYDVWHGYEVSFLTKNGLPVNGVLKLVYSSDTPNIVESKSLKLYLNSLNNTRFDKSVAISIAQVKELIIKDISPIVGGNVECQIFVSEIGSVPFDFERYTLLEDSLDLEEEFFVDYKESPSNLMISFSGAKSISVKSNLLRSNCKITEQPDWGTVFISLESEFGIDEVGLVKYLVSFRNENHFHEEVCEMIYKRLLEAYKPSKLGVTCIYTRRGGIDICPTRVSDVSLLPHLLINSEILTQKLLRQ